MSPVPQPDTARRGGRSALTLGALGVVFGDIGTSPLYALQAVFANGRITPSPADVYGVVSMVLWTLLLVVSVKYLLFVMRADNHGEGGMMALIGRLQQRGVRSPRLQAALIATGLFGVALFCGDGLITPAISVLSAVEGVELVAPSITSMIVPITLVILTALFALQRFGTAVVGRLFGPVMLLWFVALAAVGTASVLEDPAILRAVSPTYAVTFFTEHPGITFVALGAIVLVVTGAEALYADLGHFGRSAIRRAWFLIVLPALALNYLGQAAMILREPGTTTSPFFLLVPSWGRTPMIVLATVATVIASQALISGTFSLSRQAVRLGFLPRLRIVHTSERLEGQVYLPAVNALLFTGVVVVVLAFGSSQRLASAYGLAVSGTFLITSVLFLVVARTALGWSRLAVTAVGALMLTVDIAFFSANLTKLFAGGWVPMVIAAAVFTILTTWHRGQQIVRANRARDRGALETYLDGLAHHHAPLARVPGTAVFLTDTHAATPLALAEQIQHGHALHRDVVILEIVNDSRAHVRPSRRVQVSPVGPPEQQIARVTARFGFRDRMDVPAALSIARDEGLIHDVSAPVFYLSRISLELTDGPGMRRWRKRLYLVLARNAAEPGEYFALPDERVVILGARVPL